MTFEFGSFAVFPHTCSICGKGIWLENYRDSDCLRWNITKDERGVKEADKLFGVACADCARKVRDSEVVLEDRDMYTTAEICTATEILRDIRERLPRFDEETPRRIESLNMGMQALTIWARSKQ